jgi:RNA recognition motif-containing protein
MEEKATLYIGNLPYDMRSADLKDFFEGTNVEVDSVDLKRGFAFVATKQTRDELADTIPTLDGKKFPGSNLTTRVEIAKGPREPRSEGEPNETLFVANLDISTSHDALRELFSRFGDISRAEVIRNYGFVTFTSLESATRAHDEMQNTTFGDKELTVQYVAKKQRRGEGGGRRGGGRRDYDDRRRDYDRRDYDRRDYGRRDDRRDYDRRDDRRDYDDRRRHDDYDDRRRGRGRSRSRSASPVRRRRDRSRSFEREERRGDRSGSRSPPLRYN